MQKTVRMIALLSVAAMLATLGAAAATRDDLSTPNFPDVQEGELYDRNDIFTAPQDGVQHPMARAVSGAGFPAQAASRPGPVAINSEKLSFGGGGSALVSPRGGTISTPRMQADREIHRLIRKLN